MNRPILFCSLSVLFCGAPDALWAQLPGSELARQVDFNAQVLSVIESMPAGGAYSASSQATRALESAMNLTPGGLQLDARRASPSYCSGATYLVFLGTLQRLLATGALHLDKAALDALLARGQRDGEGIWGRWNANGPGTARLFFESGLGSNFTDFSRAKAGDFMKIFWTQEVGAREHGHSVVFLGTSSVAGVETVRFWSSNQPAGYGNKEVPRSKIAHALFSRLQRPAEMEGASRWAKSPDRYLGSLLEKRSSWDEVLEKCGAVGR